MKLELKHIAPYLPYRLKGKIEDTIYVEDIYEGENYSYEIEPQIVEILGAALETSFQGECIFFRGNADGYTEFNDIKPILRPLSDLTKEIDGVVGIVELAKIAFPCIVWELEGKHAVSSGINGIARKKFSYINTELTAGFSCINDASQRDYIPNQLDLFSYLFENHYDVSGLIEKGLAVDINTIEK